MGDQEHSRWRMSSAQLVFMSGTWSGYLSYSLLLIARNDFFKLTWSEHKKRPTMWKGLLELQWRWLLQRWQWRPPFDSHLRCLVDIFYTCEYGHPVIIQFVCLFAYLVIFYLTRLTPWEVSASRRGSASFNQLQESQVGWMIRPQRVRRSKDIRDILSKVSQFVRKIA